jgi:nucleotide-binding universal stress UspA family protein
MKLLAYVDNHPSCVKALEFAADLMKNLHAELSLITIRSGTHAIEPPPPFGQDVDLRDRTHLPPGVQVLANALELLTERGVVLSQQRVQIRELSNGHLFVCQTPWNQRVPFYVCFGHGIEILNREIDRHRYDLLLVAPPKRGRLQQMLSGDTLRRLVLDAHTSVLIIRRQLAGSRFVVCIDGSTSAKRVFPVLKQLLPLVSRPLDLVWVRTPGSDQACIDNAHHCLDRAGQWLIRCGKPFTIHRLEGKHPAQPISDLAGEEAVIFVGASLRHDVYRRFVGSLPTQLLGRTGANLLVGKGLPEDDPDFLEDLKTC